MEEVEEEEGVMAAATAATRPSSHGSAGCRCSAPRSRKAGVTAEEKEEAERVTVEEEQTAVLPGWGSRSGCRPKGACCQGCTRVVLG